VKFASNALGSQIYHAGRKAHTAIAFAQPATLQKGCQAMNSSFTDHFGSTMASCAVENEEQKQQQTGNFLYQAATVLAILLLLVSF
jgi:hypothetical protein